MTDLNKLRSEFESNEYINSIVQNFEWSKEFNNYQIKDCVINGDVFDLILAKDNEQFLNGAWFGWQEKAKAQAVLEHIITLQRNVEVFKFDLLDLLRRSLKSSKVLKTRENWSHVSKMVGLGSTTSTLLCKEMNVDPYGTVFVASESGAEQ